MLQSAPIPVDTASDTGVRNSQPEGIGRVAVIGSLVCWNNLGRNVVFADRHLRPLAIFGSTLFPRGDDPSQYDLDIHSILDLPEVGVLAVLNHFGTVRCFARDDILSRRPVPGSRPVPGNSTGTLVEPTRRWAFAADVERTVVAAGRIVGSRPRSGGAEGILVSAPLGQIAAHGRVPVQVCGQEHGEVTALGVVPSPNNPIIVMGGDGRVASAPLFGDRLGSTEWAAEVGFRVAWIAWHGDVVWAAGPKRMDEVDDYDWERLEGGGFVALDPSDGTQLLGGPLPADVAWGTGGVAVVPFGRTLAAVGRTGRIHLIDPSATAGLRSTAPLAESSLGIAHAAVIGRRVLFGFDRGGYRLHAWDQLVPSGQPAPVGDVPPP